MEMRKIGQLTLKGFKNLSTKEKHTGYTTKKKDPGPRFSTEKTLCPGHIASIKNILSTQL